MNKLLEARKKFPCLNSFPVSSCELFLHGAVINMFNKSLNQWPDYLVIALPPRKKVRTRLQLRITLLLEQLKQKLKKQIIFH